GRKRGRGERKGEEERERREEKRERGGKKGRSANQEGRGAAAAAARTGYRLRTTRPGAVQRTEDPDSFGLLLGELDLHLRSEGTH
ncbi:hypothetical protein ACC728_37670, partial [Rhizobium ruizarguesonis]